MFNKLGDLFSAAFESVSETLASWTSATGADWSWTSNFSSPGSSSCQSGIDACPTGSGSLGIGNAWGTTGADNQVFAESNSAFPASDFSSSFGAGSSLSCGSSCDSGNGFSSFTSSWD